MNAIPLTEAIALDDLAAALTAMQAAASTDRQRSDVLLLQSRFRQWERQSHDGTRTPAELDRDRTKLKQSALYLIDKHRWSGLSANVSLPEQAPSPALSPTSTDASRAQTSSGDTSHSPKGTTKTILFLGVQPKGTRAIRIDEEVRNLRECLQRAQWRDAFQLVDRYAVRVADLMRVLQEEKPAIVHFSGHGYPDEGLVLEDNDGKARIIDTALLTDIFRHLSRHSPIECVLLNACYSAAQAQAIVPYVGAVIGMSDALPDKSAITFTQGFYDALGTGSPYTLAYEMGRLLVRGQGLQGEEMIQYLTSA